MSRIFRDKTYTFLIFAILAGVLLAAADGYSQDKKLRRIEMKKQRPDSLVKKKNLDEKAPVEKKKNVPEENQKADSTKAEAKKIIDEYTDTENKQVPAEKKIRPERLAPDIKFQSADSAQREILYTDIIPDSLFRKTGIKTIGEIFSPGSKAVALPFNQGAYNLYLFSCAANPGYTQAVINGIPYEEPDGTGFSFSVFPRIMIDSFSSASFEPATNYNANIGSPVVTIRSRTPSESVPVSEIVYTLGRDDTSFVDLLFSRRMGKRIRFLFAGNIENERRYPYGVNARSHRIWSDISYDLSDTYQIFSYGVNSKERTGIYGALSHNGSYPYFSNLYNQRYSDYLLGIRDRFNQNRLYIRYKRKGRSFNRPGVLTSYNRLHKVYGITLDKTVISGTGEVKASVSADRYYLSGDSLLNTHGTRAGINIQSVWLKNPSHYFESFLHYKGDFDLNESALSFGGAFVGNFRNEFLVKIYAKRMKDFLYRYEYSGPAGTDEPVFSGSTMRTGISIGKRTFAGFRATADIGLIFRDKYENYTVSDDQLLISFIKDKHLLLNGSVRLEGNIWKKTELMADFSYTSQGNEYFQKINPEFSGRAVLSFIDPEDRFFPYPLSSRFNIIGTVYGPKSMAGYDPVQCVVYALPSKQKSEWFLDLHYSGKIGNFNFFYEWNNILKKNYAYIRKFPFEKSIRFWGIRWFFID